MLAFHTNSNPPATPPVKASAWNRWGRWVVLGAVGVVAAAAYPVGHHFWLRAQYRAAEQALDRRDFREANARLEKCLAARPDDPAFRLLAAQAARRGGDFKAALEHLRVYRTKHPATPEFEQEYRLLKAQQGESSEVNWVLAEALARPNAPGAALAVEASVIGGLKILGREFLRGETTEGGRATALLAQVQRGADLWLRLRPGTADQVDGLVWRGLTHTYSKDERPALADFRAALELDPRHADARLHLAMSVAQDSPQEAAKHLRILREQHPTDQRVPPLLATMLRTAGQLDEAAQLFDEMLAASPDDVPSLVERALVALDQEQPVAAERFLARALRLAPNDPQVNFALAACMRLAGRTDEAKTYQERFRQLEAERRKPTTPK